MSLFSQDPDFLSAIQLSGLTATWTREGLHSTQARGDYGEAQSETNAVHTGIPCMWDELRSDEAYRGDATLPNATSSPILFVPTIYQGNSIDIAEGDILTLNRQRSSVLHYRVHRVPDASSLEHHYEVVLEEIKRT